MVDPKKMCRQHLLGEHVELHMLAAHLKSKKSLAGYVENNLVEPESIAARHAQLVLEMKARGYNHNSPLRQPSIAYLPNQYQKTLVDTAKALAELFKRCPECKRRKTRRPV